MTALTEGKIFAQASHDGQRIRQSLTVSPRVDLISLDLGAGQVLDIGESVQIRAYGNYSDNTSTEIVEPLRWKSSDETLLKISEGGVLTGLAPGKVTVVAQFSEIEVVVKAIYDINTTEYDHDGLYTDVTYHYRVEPVFVLIGKHMEKGALSEEKALSTPPSNRAALRGDSMGAGVGNMDGLRKQLELVANPEPLLPGLALGPLYAIIERESTAEYPFVSVIIPVTNLSPDVTHCDVEINYIFKTAQNDVLQPAYGQRNLVGDIRQGRFARRRCLAPGKSGYFLIRDGSRSHASANPLTFTSIAKIEVALRDRKPLAWHNLVVDQPVDKLLEPAAEAVLKSSTPFDFAGTGQDAEVILGFDSPPAP